MGMLLMLLGLLGGQPDTTTLFRAEREFAARALTHGVDSAFLGALAPDAVLFRPGPVNGPKWIREHPGKRSTRLVWGPRAGAVSAAGDVGVTTGPWSLTDTAKPDASPWHGHFLSIWERQGNGEWKVAVDIGIAHPLPAPDAMMGRFDQHLWGDVPAGPAGSSTSDALLKAEEELLLAIDRAGTRTPFLDRIAPDAVFFRNGEPPITDHGRIKKLVGETMSPFAWRPAKAAVASSGDLAYSYGSYVAGNERGNYIRVWRLSPQGDWLILMDLTDPDA
ncbi:MAG: nuclear transport factor 2 family protein [Ignavibacteriae bacterium]|nr:nuclear transport factor 2 family protein [Ignavibacteriota bacterium]